MKFILWLFFLAVTHTALCERGVFRQKFRKIRNNIEDSELCSPCSSLIDEILQAGSEEIVLNKTEEFCNILYSDPIYCQEFIDNRGSEVIYIQEHSSENATGKDYCGILLGSDGCETEDPSRVWEVTLPDVPKPPVIEPPLDLDGNPTLTVLHLSDTHFDPNYFPGADTSKCPPYSFCCKEENGLTTNPDDAAGYWGDYRNCDLPQRTLEAIYEHILDKFPEIDFILWTGDLISHDMNTSRSTNLEVINAMADLIYDYFPGIPVYPAVGNHEAHPSDQFPQPYVDEPEFDVSWLYDGLTAIWSRWLPAEAAASVAYGGFYSVQIRPGLRILSVNTNYCYGSNLWLLLDSTDIAKELESIASELQAAEDVGDSVYIISHIPAGDTGCTWTWSHEFNKIISRYENTVTGVFYGHTHVDNFQLFFDPNNSSRVYEIGYIGPSQTTFTGLNPGYRIYTIEGNYAGSKYRVLDHENWIMDLKLSKGLNETIFRKLYSAKEDYGLADLSPESWLGFVHVMNQANSTEFADFYRNYVKDGEPSMAEGCDEACKSNILCRLLISDNSDHSHCNSLLQ